MRSPVQYAGHIGVLLDGGRVRDGAGAAARIGEMQARNGAGVLGGIESRV